VLTDLIIVSTQCCLLIIYSEEFAMATKRQSVRNSKKKDVKDAKKQRVKNVKNNG